MTNIERYITLSHIQTLIDQDGNAKAVMPFPFEPELDARTRRYMLVSEIEEAAYNFIYETILVEAEDKDAAPMGVEAAAKLIQAGGILPPFAEIPEQTQLLIWIYIDNLEIEPEGFTAISSLIHISQKAEEAS